LQARKEFGAVFKQPARTKASKARARPCCGGCRVALMISLKA